MTEPNETAEPSGASAGSVSEPAAWAALRENGSVYAAHAERDMVAGVAGDRQIVPLYRSPMLTDAEREAILFCVECCKSDVRSDIVEAALAAVARIGNSFRDAAHLVTETRRK